jgi:excisionase family DNA binding protein
MSEVVSANEAAHRFGLSEKTVRRWIAAGKLKADKRGRAYRVALSEVAALSGHDTAHDRGQKPDSGQTADIDSAPPTADSTSAMSAIPELVALVAQLHDEVRRYAEAAAVWQARAMLLEDRVKALQAPQSHQTREASNLTAEGPDPPRREPSDPPSPAPLPPTSNGSGRAPWWRRWVGWL